MCGREDGLNGALPSRPKASENEIIMHIIRVRAHKKRNVKQKVLILILRRRYGGPGAGHSARPFQFSCPLPHAMAHDGPFYR